jgi:predicted small secreted protein
MASPKPGVSDWRSERERMTGSSGHCRGRPELAHCGCLMTGQFRYRRLALTLLLVLVAAVLSACGTGASGGSAVHAQAGASGAQASGSRSQDSSASGSSGTSKTTNMPPSSSARARVVASAPPPAIPAGRTIGAFSGTGSQSIGSLSEKTPIVLQWSTAGQRIQVFTAKGFVLLESNARTGRIRLAAGKYAKLRVASPAPWTLLLRASA